jgi:hypothetical protein
MKKKMVYVLVRTQRENKLNAPQIIRHCEDTYIMYVHLTCQQNKVFII